LKSIGRTDHATNFARGFIALVRWVYIKSLSDDAILGWVFREFIACF
jgi:hypothetical protein